MSRQSRTGHPSSANSNAPPGGACSSGGGAGGGGAPSGVPVPVAQQAQQYLEENIKAWMQPTSHNNDLSTPSQPNTSATNDSPHHHHPRPTLSALNISRAQDHPQVHQRPPQVQRVPPLSPSSGYSEHSDPYLSLSLTGSGGEDGGAFPHSLSFGGCSQHSLLQGTSYSTPCGNSPFGITQPSAAASFFARAAQRLNLSTKKKKRLQLSLDPERPLFRTNFRDVIKNQPPPVPPGLLRITGRKETTSVGKVKVMLRMCASNEASSTDASYMNVDSRKKQVTLYDPTVCGQETSGERHAGIAAPKMFAFDAVFSPDDNQAEVCSSSLCDVISSVVSGSDGCLFVFGNSKLGKTSTMVGSCNSLQELGVIPCAIWWLFRAINEQKHRTGARFSVRVSAVEVSGKVEELRDLLADYAAGTEGTAPGVYLRDDPVFGSQLMNQSELRAPTAERAAFLLDAALAARTSDTEEDAKNAHFLFTLHVYQYRVEKGGRGGVAGGRSRLHLFDLGSCEKTIKSRDGSSGGCLSLSALGNVILALFNGQKHVPYKDSKLTQLLREAVGSVMCRAAMIAHVSTTPSRYPETLATLQLASRIHRLRRKKLKFSSAADVASATDDKGVCRPFVRIHAVGEDGAVKSGSSDPDYTSSSEQSCDTVIFVGSSRSPNLVGPICDRQQSMSPLAKEPSTPSKKQSSKSHHSDKNSLPAVSGSQSANMTKDHKSSDHSSKSALCPSDQQLRVAVGVGSISSPKKKSLSSSAHSSPKHQTPNSACSSPKMSKYVAMDYSSDSKKSKHSSDSPSKNSLSRISKAKVSDHHQKSTNVPPGSLTASPQSLRKSKRAHKQQDSIQPDIKIVTKEPKLSSDETWIDGPRFTKPKFDSRTLHQLQKEKWVDGPGMYGYMDVQKETMIRKWVEDNSRIATEANPKEVWIDFPPDAEDKTLSTKHVPLVDKTKKDVKSKTSDHLLPNQIVVDVETHHYAKPVITQPKQQPQDQHNETICQKEDKRDDIAKAKLPIDQIPFVTDLENSINGNLSELFERCSTRSSTSSLDFNDNNSEDMGHEAVPMVDSSIQVTEEDIFTSCGWPQELLTDNNNLSDTDSYEGGEHPLHILSADDLNLASSFTDSRAVSVDFDSMSVPEAWTADDQDMDPDLTWKLLRGGSLPHHGSRTNHPTRNFNANEGFRARNSILAAKLERLANLREVIERSSRNKKEKPVTKMSENLKELYGPDYRLFAKLHHSADSSLEELRESDGKSIHSEPTELDVDKFDFQFNVKPMNGLRLEAFYNKIHKVPLFPDCYAQFGKPTQVVPPIIKRQSIKVPIDDLKVFQRAFDEKVKFKDNVEVPNLKSRRNSFVGSKKDLVRPTLEDTEDVTNIRNSKESITAPDKESRSPARTKNSTDKIHTSLTEIIQEQRCQVYSEGPASTHVSFHSSSKCFSQKVSKSKTNCDGSIGTIETRHENQLLKQHQRKKGSPKLSPRVITNCYRNPLNGKPIKSHLSSNPSVPVISVSHESQASVSSSVSWTLTGGAVTTSIPNSESHILIRSTSTPTSPFMNNNGISYVCCSPTSTATTVLPRKECKWMTGGRQSSSGHGSDSSVISADMKECKELLGSKLSKNQQFSGTSSGYESMPRDSEGTPLSSSSQESSSEVGAKKDNRGRKGTRKKSQGSGKRSRSVPARPPVATGSPTWQQQQQPLPTPTSRQQVRGRLVRDLHDPNLWKSEEDVCCTSLLCCRLLDFY